MKNETAFKVLRKKDIIVLEAGNQTLKLDNYHQGVQEQVFQLLKDEASMVAFQDEFARLSNELLMIRAMKEEAKPILKLLYEFIYEYKHIYKTKEYKQVIAKFRNELDNAFDV
jgi:hypothetical protein